MSTIRNRVPKGTSAGGQFAPGGAHADASDLEPVRIAVDIDGTVGDFERCFGDWTRRKYGLPDDWEPYTPCYAVWVGGNWPQHTMRQFLDDLHEMEANDGYLDMEPIPGAVEQVRRLYDEGNDVFFLTARAGRTMPQTRAWLDAQGLEDIPLVSDDVKDTDVADIIIEDKPDTIERFRNDGRTAFCYAQTYNGEVSDGRTDNWLIIGDRASQAAAWLRGRSA